MMVYGNLASDYLPINGKGVEILSRFMLQNLSVIGSGMRHCGSRQDGSNPNGLPSENTSCNVHYIVSLKSCTVLLLIISLILINQISLNVTGTMMRSWVIWKRTRLTDSMSISMSVSDQDLSIKIL